MSNCKGAVYRYTENNYVTSSGITMKSQISLLKRQSCNDKCQPSPYICDCHILREYGSEELENSRSVFPENTKSGDRLRLKISSFDGYQMEGIYFEKINN